MVTGLQTRLLTELEPVVEENLERHLRAARPWAPHDYVPWSRGRDFAFLGGEDWKPEDSPLDPVAQAALVVNLLTEDTCRRITERSPHGSDVTVPGGHGWANGPPKKGGTASRFATTWW